MRFAVALMFVCGCDRVFGLAEVPDATILPADAVSDAGPGTCAKLPPGLLCADFDTAHSGLEQFMVEAPAGSTVSPTKSDSISPPSSLQAVIPPGPGLGHAWASFDLAVQGFRGSVAFDVKVMDLAACQPTIIAIDFPGTGYEIGMFTTQTTYETYIAGTGCTVGSDSIALLPSEWHHVLMTLSVPDGTVGIAIDARPGSVQCNPGLAGTTVTPTLRFGGSIETSHDGECATLIDNIVVQ